ncbi:MAG: putative LPS assembly protein LptD [bacterium]
MSKFLGTLKIIVLLLIAGSVSLFSQTQQKAVSDTSRSTASAQTDSLKSTKSGIDTTVVYSASDSILYSMRTRTMQLFGKGDLSYRTMGLKAERIQINWESSNLYAEGIKDTADKSGRKMTGTPLLKDGGEEYKGKEVSYNFKTKKGKIDVGDTEIEQGYYHGEAIKKVEPEVLFVANGRYTTCDAEQPHYYFSSSKMKVVMHDHIVAEPITFYIADIPVFALPFGVFPNKAGRRSGLIAPAYGEDFRRGRFLSHFGYYWAMNDYMDLASSFDWYMRGGWLNRTAFQYNVRYQFSGMVRMEYSDLYTGESGDPGRTRQNDYYLSINHNQQFNPTMRLDVNFSFSSGTHFQNTSFNLDELLRQNIVSTATLTKRWEDGDRNLTVSIYRDQNLQSGDVAERMPSISFSQGLWFPFRRASKGSQSGSESDYGWYENIGINYSGEAQGNRSKLSTLNSANEKQTTINENYGANHSLSFSFSPKAGYFTISPTFGYNEKWYVKKIDRDSTGDHKINGFFPVRTFSSGIGLSTRLFGIFQPQVFGITGIRHTVTPTVSFSYTPDFSSTNFGYWGTYVDTNKKVVQYDHFEKEIYGGAPRGLTQSLNFSVGNLFEMKYQSADTAEKEKKIQLMNIGANLSYNFAADSMRLSDLSISYRTDIGSILSLSAGTTHNFYVFDTTAGRRVNRFLWSDRRRLFDVTSVSFNVSTSLSGERKTQTQSTSKSQPAGDQSTLKQMNPQQGMMPGVPRVVDENASDFSIPWNLSLSYTFSQSTPNPNQTFRSSSMNANLSFNLTEYWRITASGNYDFTMKQFSAPSVSVLRDLHCWEMRFDWVPLGPYRYYRFEIRVKAPQLQDIKLTKQGSERGVY